MNIFFLDKDPKLAAQYQCDKHVIKMTLETTQMLSIAWSIRGGDKKPKFLYKATQAQINHPCSIWTRFRIPNYKWLALHGFYLSKEYTKRYGKTHACHKRLIWFYQNVPTTMNDEHTEISDPAQAMPDPYKDNDTIRAYRKFYTFYKFFAIDLSYSRGTSAPDWLQVHLDHFSQHGIS